MALNLEEKRFQTLVRGKWGRGEWDGANATPNIYNRDFSMILWDSAAPARTEKVVMIGKWMHLEDDT